MTLIFDSDKSAGTFIIIVEDVALTCMSLNMFSVNFTL